MISSYFILGSRYLIPMLPNHLKSLNLFYRYIDLKFCKHLSKHETWFFSIFEYEYLHCVKNIF